MPLCTVDECDKLTRLRFTLRSSNDRCHLKQWMIGMQLSGNKGPVAVTLNTERERDNSGINIAGICQGQRLGDILPEDEARLHCIPDASSLQRLFCCLTVRGMLRVGDCDPPIDQIAQILHARRL